MLISNIFVALFKSQNYFRIVFPHLKREYFPERADKLLLDTIGKYYAYASKQGSFSDILLLVDTDTDIPQEETELIKEKLQTLRKTDMVSDEKLLISKTEEWCRDRAFELAVLYAADLIQSNSSNKGVTVDKVKDALAIEFEVKLGHDYWSKQDTLSRMKSYMEAEDKIELDIDKINEAMGGGLVKNGLFMYMANTNVGKTTWLCHSAASLVKSGKNILYITAEMSEKEINKRIDANIFDIAMENLSPKLDTKEFKNKFKALLEKTHGELVVKYCSAGAMNALHIKNLLQELKLKKGFIPDVLVLDHLTLFTSSRLPASQTGTHTYLQCVVEEIRAIGGKDEFDCAILSACQLNRGAKVKKEGVSNEDVALAYAISQTADWSGALLQPDELRKVGKYLLKVLKTRYASNNEFTYTIGIDFSKMRLENLSEEEQEVPLHVRDTLRNEQKKAEEEETAAVWDYATA
jgi:archaellum biogenesis ATPase FlaH